MSKVFLGIDYGEKRVGIARSDELGMFAHPVGYIENTGIAEVLDSVKRYCEEFGVSKIIIGLPRNMDGSEGASAEKVRQFIQGLEEAVSIPVFEWDERLSTKAASAFMRDAGIKKKKKKSKVDQVAAQIILQGYLDSAY